MVKHTETVKQNKEPPFIFVTELFRQLEKETGAFEVLTIEEIHDLRHTGTTPQGDYLLTIHTIPDNHLIKLIVETKRNLTPQTVIEISKRLNHLNMHSSRLVLCCPYISKRVIEICREHSLGYLDEVGNCRLSLPGLFIQISGKSNKQTLRKSAVDPFSRKSSRIVRTLLTNPETNWQVQHLARTAEVSMGLASKVKNKLIEEAYIEERNRLLYLSDPKKLLQAWATRYQPEVKRLLLFTASRPPETESRLAEWCRTTNVPYALTQLSGAWRLSPLIRYDKSVFYIDKTIVSVATLGSLLSHIDAKEVETGANCVLWITDESSVFWGAKEIEGVNVASPIQLYLDLSQLAGRGEEMAKEILESQFGHHTAHNPTGR